MNNPIREFLGSISTPTRLDEEQYSYHVPTGDLHEWSDLVDTLQGGGWVSVSEPPKHGTKVLIFNGYHIFKGQYSNEITQYEDSEFWDEMTSESIVGATHWQSLPEPPNGE